MQSLQSASGMRGATRPISLRLAPCHIEQLKARALTVSGSLTGVARELILTGLAGATSAMLPVPRHKGLMTAVLLSSKRAEPRPPCQIIRGVLLALSARPLSKAPDPIALDQLWVGIFGVDMHSASNRSFPWQRPTLRNPPKHL